MPVLIDLEDDVVQAKLEKARATGFMTYEQLNELLPAGDIDSADVADTLEMLSAMGIEVTDGRTEEERDQAVADAINAWIAAGNMMPQLTGDGWAALSRVSEREKAGWRAKLGVPDGIEIPERPIPEDDEELLDEFTLYGEEMQSLFDMRMSPECPGGQEGAALDSRCIYVMNRRFKLQCELRDRIRDGRFRKSR